MKVLIACEYSGKVREAFRALGHDAYSCDLLAADDDSQYHYTGIWFYFGKNELVNICKDDISNLIN